MTRGKLILIEPGRITTSPEFNGDMGAHDDMGKKAIKKMLAVKSYSSFIKVSQYFKKEYNYEHDEDAYYPAWYYSMMQLFDMTSEYFDKYGSDYLYIKNLSGEKVFIKASTSNDNGFELLSLDDGAFGVLHYGEFDECVDIQENQFELADPNDKAISWAFTESDCAWYAPTLHRMASVSFGNNSDKTFDYISEGYDIKPGDMVVVRGKGKELRKVCVSSLHWATDEDLEAALPGGIKRFKKIEGKVI